MALQLLLPSPPPRRSPAEHTPPVTVTLVRGKSRRLYERLAAWDPPPGWEEGEFLRRSVIYPALRPGLLLRELGEDLVIHDPGTFDCHSLNRPAAAILLLANGSRTVEEIALAYEEKFSLEPGTARADVHAILVDLIEKKVILARRSKSI